MEAVTDNLRKPDVNNPYGYYEYGKVKNIREDASWLPDNRGKVCKMISLLLFDLPGQYEYSIVFMKRDMNEILASQEAMLQSLGKNVGTDAGRMRELLARHLTHLESWLQQQGNIEVLYIRYRDVLDNPAGIANRLARFFRRPLETRNMIAAVDFSLYRTR